MLHMVNGLALDRKCFFFLVFSGYGVKSSVIRVHTKKFVKWTNSSNMIKNQVSGLKFTTFYFLKFNKGYNFYNFSFSWCALYMVELWKIR